MLYTFLQVKVTEEGYMPEFTQPVHPGVGYDQAGHPVDEEGNPIYATGGGEGDPDGPGDESGDPEGEDYTEEGEGDAEGEGDQGAEGDEPPAQEARSRRKRVAVN